MSNFLGGWGGGQDPCDPRRCFFLAAPPRGRDRRISLSFVHAQRGTKPANNPYRRIPTGIMPECRRGRCKHSGQTGTEACRCSTANAKFVPDLDPRERARSACQSAAAQPQPNAAQPALHSRDSPRDSAPAPRAIDETPIDTRQLSHSWTRQSPAQMPVSTPMLPRRS